VKPAVFVGSSTESLAIAYAIQENLEREAEVTVWSQGIFELSKYTLDSLVDVLDAADFGVFVFAPDDVSIIRGAEKNSVRDNVIFELGLFVGRLSRERSFVILPRGSEESFHLPTDLLGLTPALFDASRQDGNLNAALGPACSKISKSLVRLGRISRQETELEPQPLVQPIEYSEGDAKAIIASWMGSRPASQNSQVIHFAEIDRELRLEPGTTKRYIKEIAKKWRYIVEHDGEHTILFRQDQQNSRSSETSWIVGKARMVR